MRNIIELGLALLALILIKNVLEAIYIIELGPCMVGARNFLIVVLEASQTFLGMVRGGGRVGVGTDRTYGP